MSHKDTVESYPSNRFCCWQKITKFYASILSFPAEPNNYFVSPVGSRKKKYHGLVSGKNHGFERNEMLTCFSVDETNQKQKAWVKI